MAEQFEDANIVVGTEEPLARHRDIVRAFNRRNFLAGIGMGGAALATAGLMAGCGSDGAMAVSAAGTSEADVLNFALNLEYFEATLYSYLVNGGDIPAASTGGGSSASGTVTGAPAKLTGLSQQITDILNEVYFDEISHVNDLRTAISAAGGTPVNRPNLKLDALGAITAANALIYARLVEDVGVTAYCGAATALTSTNLQYAAQILAVEAFHSGALRLLHIQAGATAALTSDGLDVKPADPGTAALAQAGPTTANGGFFATAGASSAQSGTFPGMAYKRTTSQVLAVVYGTTTTGATSGGFFPNGLNGNIKAI